jgi:integrase
MSVRCVRTPSLRLHKPSGLAVVTLGGRDVYVGRYGTPESRAEYDRVVAEWLLNGRGLPAPVSGAGADLTVNEFLVAYLNHVDSYYVKNGRPTKESEDIRYAVRPLRQLYGHTLARDFGPLALKTVRKALIASGLCRNEVNKRVGKIKRAFRWAVSEEMIPPSVDHGLQTVPGLRRGRADVRESEPVKPVPDAQVDAIRPHVSRQVWAMVQLQRLTGMRPGEVVAMRTIDLDTSGRVWLYAPGSHKTEHHGKRRTIYLGPQARAVLREWLRPDLAAPLFQPRDAMAERRAERRRGRKTPVQPSQRNRAKSRPKKQPGTTYSVQSYGRSIDYGCDKANVPRWHPNQLRHNAATRLRKEFGLDVARAVLGHASPAVTEVYAELDGAKAVEAMEQVG